MFEHDANTVVWGASPLFLLAGSFFHIISIATPHWLNSLDGHTGLWSFCSVDGECISITERLNDLDHASWYRAVQGLEIAATVFVLTALVTGLMKINLGPYIWQLACGISALIAGSLGVAAVAVFSRSYTSLPGQALSWAFVFNAFSSGATLLAGPLLVIDSLLHKS